MGGEAWGSNDHLQTKNVCDGRPSDFRIGKMGSCPQHNKSGRRSIIFLRDWNDGMSADRLTCEQRGGGGCFLYRWSDSAVEGLTFDEQER